MSSRETVLALHRHIRSGNFTEVVRLVSNDAELLMIRTPFGTWLEDAASYGHLPIVKWFVEQGLPVNEADDSGETPALGRAAANGHIGVVKYLLEAGASLDVSNSSHNPLISSIFGGGSAEHTEVARLLIESGLDTSIRYPQLDNMSALDFALEWGRSEVVALLTPPNGSTP